MLHYHVRPAFFLRGWNSFSVTYNKVVGILLKATQCSTAAEILASQVSLGGKYCKDTHTIHFSSVDSNMIMNNMELENEKNTVDPEDA